MIQQKRKDRFCLRKLL